MTKKCAICEEEIKEDNGKLQGTMLRVVEDKKASYIYVCSSCQKKDKNYLEKAKVRTA